MQHEFGALGGGCRADPRKHAGAAHPSWTGAPPPGNWEAIGIPSLSALLRKGVYFFFPFFFPFFLAAFFFFLAMAPHLLSIVAFSPAFPEPRCSARRLTGNRQVRAGSRSQTGYRSSQGVTRRDRAKNSALSLK